MRIVAALGGNALARRGQAPPVQALRDKLAAAAQALAPLARAHQLVISHGNGPQVGLLALQAAAYAAAEIPEASLPLDRLRAESETTVGCLIEQALASAMPERRVATLLPQVEVDADDPAFAAPSKPVGPPYSASCLGRVQYPAGWQFARDGEHWRRVVASPRPLRVLEQSVIALLLEQGVTVVCAGGGGVPLVQREGRWFGVEAVIDGDRTSGLLARCLDAELLLLLTDVPGVAPDFGALQPQWLQRETPACLSALALPAASIGSKVRAAVEFVQASGRRAAIGCLDDVLALVQGQAGTQVLPDGDADLVEAPPPWRLVVDR